MKLTYILFALLFCFQFQSFAQDDKIIAEDLVFYEGIRTYPNPATDVVTISYGYQDDEFNNTSFWVEFENQGLVDIYSINGHRVINTVNLSNQDYRQDIPVSDLKSGVYFFIIRIDDKEPLTHKIVVL